jgi:hypothetical protein
VRVSRPAEPPAIPERQSFEAVIVSIALKPPSGMRVVATTGAIIIDRPVLGPIPDDSPLLDDLIADGGTQRDRFRRAQDTVDRLASGWSPDDALLCDAPLLDHWGFFFRTPAALTFFGIVTGHPHIADGRRCYTSPVIAYDGRLGIWVRTVSRWYRLGRPLRHGDHS